MNRVYILPAYGPATTQERAELRALSYDAPEIEEDNDYESE